MRAHLASMLLILPLLVTCAREKPEAAKPFDAAFVRLSPDEIVSLPLAVRFDPPLGGERGALTYNAQPFRVTRHLGDDLNGIGGWNSDFGDPVFAAGVGRVIYAGVPGPGWGNMLILAHRVPDPTAVLGWRVYETVYAHMEKMLASKGETVKRGQRIGSVGTANGKYFAHLHFEVRESTSVYPGPGYSDAPLDRVSPEAFVAAHHGSMNDEILPAP
jgi:murein DD-endopeptidase MepM/ murein hydrolase activator NlpD